MYTENLKSESSQETSTKLCIHEFCFCLTSTQRDERLKGKRKRRLPKSNHGGGVGGICNDNENCSFLYYSCLGLVGLGREANGEYGIALQLALPPAKV
jgi:hypothetical protein